MDERGSKRFLLVSSPRTASNLLMRILNLNQQSTIAPTEQRDYFFLPGLKFIVNNDLLAKAIDEWTQSEKDNVYAAHQSGFDGLQALVKDSEAQGKNVFVKEHSGFFLDPVAASKLLHGAESASEAPWTVMDESETAIRTNTNPTILPDDFLKTWHATFLIRHPIVTFPSFQRVSLEIYGAKASENWVWAIGPLLHWPRMLYEWFCARKELADDTWPIVLDADDFITDPDVVRAYSDIISIDQSNLMFEWDAVGEEGMSKMHPHLRTMADTLFRSSNVTKAKDPHELSVEEEAKRWKEEFGVEIAESLEKRVRDAMPDYEYLWNRRFRKDDAK